MTHRFFALLVFCYLAWLGICLIRENLHRSGVLLIAALTLQVAVGISAITYDFPLFLVLMHNAMAASLLLILVTLNYWVHKR